MDSFPHPCINAAAVAGVAIKLVHSLGKLYEVPFREDQVKSVVTSLVGGALSTELGVGAAGLLKGWPFVGGLLSVAAVPAFGGAAVYAIGKVFIQHFESGGTFLDFDPAKVETVLPGSVQPGQDRGSLMRQVRQPDRRVKDAS